MGLQGICAGRPPRSAWFGWASFKGLFSLLLSFCLAIPQGWAAAQWGFDPQERYQTGLKAFEVGEYRLAIELWMDILGDPAALELEARTLQLIGENVVSAFEAALKIEPDEAALLVAAGKFCSIYTERHSSSAFSRIVDDACVDWPERSIDEQQALTPAQAEISERASHLRMADQPHFAEQGVERSVATKVGLGLLFAGLAAGAVGVGGMVAEGSWIQRYHASLDAGRPELQLRKGADSWRTIATVSAGLSLSFVAFGAVLCVLGTKKKPVFKSRQSAMVPKRHWSLGARGLRLRF